MTVDWLLEQAKSASPLFAFGCLCALGMLWRQYIKDQNTIKSLTSSTTKALVAIARAMTKLAAKFEGKK